MERQSAHESLREVLDLFDNHVHGGIDRRRFVERAARFAVGGLTGAALLSALSPRYALAQEVAPDDARITTSRESYTSEAGYGKVEGLMARPVGQGKLPAVLVVHEDRGLNPHIEDVARRLAVAGYLALAPDGLTSLGGYPGTDDEGRKLQGKLDREKLILDFLAGAKHLQGHAACTGKVGVVGFGFGGMVAYQLALRCEGLNGAVPFYGMPPAAEETGKLKAPLLMHTAEHDTKIMEAMQPWSEALMRGPNPTKYAFAWHTYEGTNHGFHDDTTPRYDEKAAKLAWSRTLDFFADRLE
ncbi:MAG: dienelactone hydrolase family protein [Planctomycetes bacterium]|nr:dienelactone hydrolase family protein [Planctomycetota bacterium]